LSKKKKSEAKAEPVVEKTPAEPAKEKTEKPVTYDLDKVVEVLSKDFEVKPEEIEVILSKLMNEESYTLMGAVSKFRSDNKFQQTQAGREYVGRLIGKGGKRTQDIGGGRAETVCNFAWLVEEAGVPAILTATFWGDERVATAQDLEFLKCYKFSAQKRPDNSLTRSSGFVKVDDGSVVKVKDLPKKGVDFAKLSKLEEYVDSSDLFYGFIGRMIESQDTGEIIGFEIGDIDAGPFTIWTGGKFTTAPDDVADIVKNLSIGDEVVVFGWVSHPPEKAIRINARGIIPL